MTVINSEALDTLLLRLEARIHRDGWDAPAQLYVVYDSSNLAIATRYRKLFGGYGAAVHGGLYEARPIMPSGTLVGVLSHDLHHMLTNLSDPRLSPSAEIFWRTLGLPGVVAIALSAEAWTRPIDPGEDLHGRSLADIPGSRETRLVLAAAIDDVVRFLRRNRDEPPQFVHGDPGGPLVECLRYLTGRATGAYVAPFPQAPRGWVASPV